VIVVVALALRLVDAGFRLSHDEGYSWLVATAPNAGSFLSRLAHYENTPPLFYVLLTPLPLDREVWLRLPSIIAGTASVPLLYAIVRPLLRSRTALVAALGLAVAPFAVSYSDYSRGFMVAGVGLLVALLSAVYLIKGGRRRWWWGYALGGTWALYSEYYAGIYLLAILGALLAVGRPRGRDVLLVGCVPFLALLPWLPEIIRSADELGRTKLQFSSHAPSPGLIRNALVPLFFGEHGAAHSLALRSAQAVGVIAVLGYACARLWRASRVAFWLLAGVMITAIIGHLVVTAIDTNIFEERYLTTVIPLAAAVLAGAISTIRWRLALPVTGVVLAAVGIGIVLARAGRQYEPDSPGAVALVRARGYRTILTNSAVVAFYGRTLHVVLDRPFGLGAGRERSCAPACAVVDDSRFGGVRPGPGQRIALGPIVVRFPPREGP
jgi:4-amino-4-deoxy-L-arabinose transferase-like glycosyltransferase